jgi:hypothetical protein
MSGISKYGEQPSPNVMGIGQRRTVTRIEVNRGSTVPPNLANGDGEFGHPRSTAAHRPVPRWRCWRSGGGALTWLTAKRRPQPRAVLGARRSVVADPVARAARRRPGSSCPDRGTTLGAAVDEAMPSAHRHDGRPRARTPMRRRWRPCRREDGRFGYGRSLVERVAVGSRHTESLVERSRRMESLLSQPRPLRAHMYRDARVSA